MPIPTSDLQEQFKAPKVARGQAVDASKAVSDAYIPALNTIKQINNAGNSALKFAVAQRRADSSYKAQDALNEYIVGRDELDNWYRSQTYELAQKNKSLYYSKSKALHDKFVSKLNTVEDGDIRENFRQQANSFNIKEFQSTEAFIYEQKTKAEDEVFNKGLQLKSDNASRSLNPYNNASQNAEAFKGSLVSGFADIDNMAAQRGWPKEMSFVKKQQWAGDTLKKAIYDMASKVDTGIDDDPLKETRDFIEKIRGYVPEDVWMNTAREYGEKSLNLAYFKNPLAFTNEKGEYDDAKAAYYAKYLDADERKKKVIDLQSGNYNNGNAKDGIVSAELYENILGEVKKNLQDTGTFKYWKIDNSNEFWNDPKALERLQERGSSEKLADAIMALDNIYHGRIFYNAETKEIIKDTGQSRQAMENNGYRPYVIGPATDKEKEKIRLTINNLNQVLGQMAWEGTIDKTEFGSKWITPTEPSFNLDVKTFAQQANYAATKDGFFTPLLRKVGLRDERKLGMSSDMQLQINKNLQYQISNAFKEMNDNSENEFKQDSSIFERPTIELMQYLDDLDEQSSLLNGKKRWDLIEEAFANTAKSLTHEQMQWIASNTTQDSSPGENYYDMLSLTPQGKQKVYARDFFVARQRMQRNKRLKRNYNVVKYGLMATPLTAGIGMSLTALETATSVVGGASENKKTVGDTIVGD